MYSPSHRQDRAKMINIQATLRTGPELCKNESLAVLYGSNGISYTVRYVYIYTYSSQYRSWSGKRNLEIGTGVNAACHSFASPNLNSILGTASLIAFNSKKTSYFVTY